MEPPVVFPPVLVATVMVPPSPVVMLLRAAVPVPPPAAFTLIVTALELLSVVVIELPADMVKLLAPLPPWFTLMVTGPEAVMISEVPRVKPVKACNKRAPLVMLLPVVSEPPLLFKVKAPVPVLRAVAGKVNVPEEITVSGTLATLRVGVARVMLPVLDT